MPLESVIVNSSNGCRGLGKDLCNNHMSMKASPCVELYTCLDKNVVRSGILRVACCACHTLHATLQSLSSYSTGQLRHSPMVLQEPLAMCKVQLKQMAGMSAHLHKDQEVPHPVSTRWLRQSNFCGRGGTDASRC